MPGKTFSSIALLLGAGLLLLQGCGFHLKQEARLDPSIGPMLIQGIPQHDSLHRALALQLQESGIALAGNAGEAGSILQLSRRTHHRRVLSVDAHGKTAEYELHEGVEFELLSPTERTLVAQHSIDVIQPYLNQEDQVLGKRIEEEMLRRDMAGELASRLLRMLQAQLGN